MKKEGNDRFMRQTTPKGHEIPMPTRGEFYDNLKKASDAKPSRFRRRREKDQ